MRIADLVKQEVRRDPFHFVPGREATVLLLSMRRVMDLVASCALYEFEDIAVELTGADRLEPEALALVELERKVYKSFRYLTGSAAVAALLSPRLSRSVLKKDYDLFFPVFNHPYELFALNAIPNWRQRCRQAACYISEVWARRFPEYLVELLAPFDRIYLGVTQPVEAVARITGRPCSYLPLGVDALLFSPYPEEPPLTVDVCGIGRRSPMTHEALLAFARERNHFYYYDTVRTEGRGVVNNARQITFSVSSPAEHRLLLSNLLKRSRFFIANRARANEPEVTGDTEEIAGRFFEGAAAGAVIVGAPPTTATWREHFGWPDAVISTPFHSPRIGDLLTDLCADPARLARIRRDNVVNSLRRHDWGYRLHKVFADAGLSPTPAMQARAARLRSLAARVEGAAAA